MGLTREDRIERWASKAQEQLAYCISCQPFDGGEMLWIHGNQMSLADLLCKLGVPEDIHRDVAQELSCRNCGACDFDLFTRIGTPTSEERAIRERWRTWRTRYAKRVEEFAVYLSKYPYLGMKHSLGRAIARAITDFPRINLDQSEWWRARMPDGERVFSSSDMTPPPSKSARSEGRFNHFGQVVFYLSSGRDGAAIEVLPSAEGGGQVWLQRFRVEAIPDVLDLTQPSYWDASDTPVLALGLISEISRFAPDHDSPWKPEYFIPRFIADCAREAEFRAVRFDSARHPYQNLVVFDGENLGYSNPIGNQELYCLRGQRGLSRVSADTSDDFSL